MNEGTTAIVDLGAEQAGGAGDWAILVLAAIIAAGYLVRKFVGRRGPCAGCGKSGSCSSAAAKTAKDPPAGAS